MCMCRGRDCVAHTVDISLWVNAQKEYGISSHDPASWTKHSISYQHNRLWKGDPQFLFDNKVNDTTKWETLSYTALLVTVMFIGFSRKLIRLSIHYQSRRFTTAKNLRRGLDRERSSIITSESDTGSLCYSENKQPSSDLLRLAAMLLGTRHGARSIHQPTSSCNFPSPRTRTWRRRLRTRTERSSRQTMPCDRS